MTDHRLQQFARQTAAEPEDVARLETRLDAALPPVDISRLLATLPEIHPAQVARLQRRVARAPSAGSRRRLPPLVSGLTPRLVPTLALCAAAAAALVMLLPLERDVSVALSAGQVEIGDGLRLTASGAGQVTGTTLRPEITWSRGLLRVDQEPDAGIETRIQTAEGTVSVLGTVFTVKRDSELLSTVVEMTRGSVLLRCKDGSSHTLGAGQSGVCLPATATQMATRATRLKERGDHAAALASLDRALELPQEGRVYTAGLLAVRVEVLHQLGRDAEILETIQRYRGEAETQDDPDRWFELARLGAALALAAGERDVARPMLTELAPTSLEHAIWLAECTEASEQAAAVLERAASLVSEPAGQAALTAAWARLEAR